MFIYCRAPSGLPPLLCHGVPAVLGGCLVSPCGGGTVLVTVSGDERARASARASPRMKRRRRPRPRASRCHRRCFLRWCRVTVCVVRVKTSLACRRSWARLCSCSRRPSRSSARVMFCRISSATSSASRWHCASPAWGHRGQCGDTVGTWGDAVGTLRIWGLWPRGTMGTQGLWGQRDTEISGAWGHGDAMGTGRDTKDMGTMRKGDWAYMGTQYGDCVDGPCGDQGT